MILVDFLGNNNIFSKVFCHALSLLRLGFNETSCDLRNVLGSLERLVIDVRKKEQADTKRNKASFSPKSARHSQSLGASTGWVGGKRQRETAVVVVSQMWCAGA